MNFKSYVVEFLFFITFCAVTVHCNDNHNATGGGGIHPKSLQLGGDCGGTVFLFEMNPARSWSEAREFCRSRNLRLASIRSAQQTQCLVQSAQKTPEFRGRFWTAAREDRELVTGMLVWEGSPNNEQPRSDSFARTYYVTESQYPYHSCGAFDSVEGTFQLLPCPAYLGSLCQSS